jgi:hypothetical protein
MGRAAATQDTSRSKEYVLAETTHMRTGGFEIILVKEVQDSQGFPYAKATCKVSFE